MKSDIKYTPEYYYLAQYSAVRNQYVVKNISKVELKLKRLASAVVERIKNNQPIYTLSNGVLVH